MKGHARRKSSFTLPADEHARVLRLKRLLRAPSNTDVIRRSLRLLEESIARDALRARFHEAATRVKEATSHEVRALDALVGEGLERD